MCHVYQLMYINLLLLEALHSILQMPVLQVMSNNPITSGKNLQHGDNLFEDVEREGNIKSVHENRVEEGILEEVKVVNLRQEDLS
jgi:hypothetical protein